ncbi:MAG: DUF4292 domain-containing protein [Cyclobacteriaceae bacterium]
MKSKVKVLWWALLLPIIVACNKNIFKPTISNNPVELNLQEFDFDYLTAKAKFQFDNEKNDLKATANIRIRKDSVIWMSISPTLGIEAARALFTTDSITIMDRIHKRYVVFDYQKISEKYNFKITYSLIQDILLGNMSNPIVREDKVTKETRHFLVLQDRGSLKMENFVGLQTMKLERSHWLDIPTQNTLSINYSNFQLVNEFVFPFENQIILKYKGADDKPSDTLINIDFNKAEISDKKERFPFNIPDKYERKG